MGSTPQSRPLMTRPPAISHSAPGDARLVEALCLVMFILVGTDVVSVVVGEGSPLIAQLRLLSYLGIVGLSIAYHRVVVGALLAAPWLTALIGMACLSVLWSISPATTLRGLVHFLGCTALGLLLGRALSLRGLILFLARLALTIAVVSLIAVALFPSARGVPPWDYVWRGIFSHKNALGSGCAILLPLVTHAAFAERGARRLLFSVGTLGLLILLAASFSRTSQIIAGIALCNLGLAVALPSRQQAWASASTAVFLFTVVGLPLLFSTALPGLFFESIGRQPTMSGRVPLWQTVWPWVEQRPWLGFGYSAFWDPLSRRVFEISLAPDIQYIPFYSHNGVIEVLLGLGAVGLALLSMVYLQVFVAIFRTMRKRPEALDLAPVLITLISFLLLNMTEAPVLQQNSLAWIIFVMFVVRLGTLARSASRHPNSSGTDETGRDASLSIRPSAPGG